jgi:YgiT-type zinc finger domain-containing protein
MGKCCGDVSKMSKVCSFCGNKNFKIKKVQYIYKHDDKFLIVNDVPCEECEYCGEQYFKADVLKKIEKDFMEIYSVGKKSKNLIQVPVEEFVEL